MINLREIGIGLGVGCFIILIIFGVMYVPGFFADRSLPDKQSIKFISINDYSFRDWALRLNDQNLKVPHTGYFKSHLIAVPILLKDLGIAEESQNSKRILGQFESLGQKTELIGKFEAIVTQYQPTKITIDLFSGKFNDANVSGNRISGKINITENIESNAIDGNLQIGSTNYGGIPFGGTNLRFKGDMNAINANITTQVSGHQGTSVELTGTFVQQNFLNIKGLLNITAASDLVKTVQMIAAGREFPLPPFFNKIKPLQIEITQDLTSKISADSVKFDVETSYFGQGFKSAAILDKSKSRLQLGARFENFWLDAYPYDLTKTSGEVRTQAIAELSLDQKDNDTYGPFTTRLENIVLEKEGFKLTDVNGLITYESLSPVKVDMISLSASEMFLDEPITNVVFEMDYDDNERLTPRNISGLWNNRKTLFEPQANESYTLPDLDVSNVYNEFAEVSELLKLDLTFSAPLKFSKTWKFKDKGYQSEDLKFVNTEQGVLTLNENIPELTNIYVDDMTLVLDDKTASLKVKGTHPLIYGKKPIRIDTTLERRVE